MRPEPKSNKRRFHFKSIAEELKSESDAVAPLCDELICLAEDFDFDGIQKFLLDLDT